MANLFLNCGGNAAAPYGADAYFLNGSPIAAGTAGFVVWANTVQNPPPLAVLESARSIAAGAIQYLFTGFAPNSTQRVTLFLMEHSAFVTAIGQRTFHIDINGARRATDVDIFALAGGKGIGISLMFVATADANGQIALDLTKSVGDPLVNAIMVIAPPALPSQTIDWDGIIYYPVRPDVKADGLVAVLPANAPLSEGQEVGHLFNKLGHANEGVGVNVTVNLGAPRPSSASLQIFLPLFRKERGIITDWLGRVVQ